MYNKVLGVCLVVVLLLGVSNLCAQTVTGTLSGHIMDTSGAVMPKVKVSAKNEQIGTLREATTNEEGYYLMSFLPIGSYTVTVAVSGFNTVEKKGVLIELNKNTVSDFALGPAAVTATVEVKAGEIPLIETTIGELKHSLDARTIESTPLPGRNFISLVEQIPGFQNAPWITSSNNPTNSTGSYAVFSGTGSRSATFQIDGVNNDDSSENQNRQNVNVSAIKEFQVLTNAYSAEFGRAGGAVLLVQTKSGTNAFHGDLYDFIQNDIFNANGFFQKQGGTPRQPIRRNQFGGTVGGPILKDKLFFFGSGEHTTNVGKGTITRLTWLPTDQTGKTLPRACDPGETAQPGSATNPLGIYCVDPATHPNVQNDLAFLRSIMNLWDTPQLSGQTPNDPIACAQMIATGRANRCVRVGGLGIDFPDSDYSGRLDWNAPASTTVALRYHYSRQIRNSPRVILGDNFGTVNNRQYNVGLSVTHVFSNRQTGEVRYGFGNRATLQDVTDGNTIPTIRFANVGYTAALTSDTIAFPGTIIGTSTNVPINRRQRDHQVVYNHTIVFNRHTLRSGADQRFQALDDIASGTQRGFWTFGNIAGALGAGFFGWENFLRGLFTSFSKGFGPAFAETRFGETNLYAQDDVRLRPNLTLNLGLRWEVVRAPKEEENRFRFGYRGDYNNVEPRIGFAWSPGSHGRFLDRLTGGANNAAIRGGFGVAHGRVFQSIFSQSGLNFRFQPPNGFTLAALAGPCATNPSNPQSEVADPTCGFAFTPGQATRSVPAACSLTASGCNGVKVAGGQLLTTLLIPARGFHLPYVEQWNLTLERKLPWRMALQVGYNGNRGIGLPFFNGDNKAQFPITSPLVTVDVGGGNFQSVVFDRVCLNNTDPICPSGSLTAFSALTSTTATLAQKGIVIVSGVPHGYISIGSAASRRLAERRPDPTFGRNVTLTNFAWSYYHAMVLKVTKATSHGLSFTGSWTLSKAIDTGSEATFTGVDVNVPVGPVNPARSLRALSGFDARHRVVLSYAYDLPWMKSQQGVLGRIVGGWTISGVTTFQSGNPFSVAFGDDINLDGEGGDRPGLSDLSLLYTSIDGGRAQSPCPTTTTVCQDTASQLQLSGGSFIPTQPANGTLAGIGGNNIPLTPGQDNPGTIGRNVFFTQGMKNFDMTLAKSVRVRESMRVELRFELYNAFNRVMFDTPARTVLSTTPTGRVTGTRNPANFVNSFRTIGSRMGQLAIRFVF